MKLPGRWHIVIALLLAVGYLLVPRSARSGPLDAVPKPGTLVHSQADSVVAAIRDLVNQGKYAEAENSASGLLGPTSPTRIDSLQRADLLDLRAEALMRDGKAAQPVALETIKQAVALRQRIQGPNHPDVAKSFSLLGNIYRARGEFADARSCHQRALTIRQASLGLTHADVGVSLHNLALIHQDLGEYPEARLLYERAIVIHQTALGPDHLRVAASSNNLANVLRSMGEVVEGLRLSERALAIREKNLGPEHPLVAEGLHNLALQHQEMGDLETARPLYERAVAIEEKSLGPDHPFLASTLNNLGNLLGSLGEFSAARADLERALEIRERVLGPNHPDVGESATSLGYLMEKNGELDSARRLYGRGLAIAESSLGSNHVLVAAHLDNVGVLEWRKGHSDSAEVLSQRSAAIRRRALGADHPDVGKSLIDMALALAAQGRAQAALDTVLEGNRILNQHLLLASRSLAERQALDYQSTNTGMGLCLSLASELNARDPSTADRVWEAVTRSRAAVLDEMAARHRTIVEAGDSTLTLLAERWSSSRQRLANLVVRGVGSEDPGRYQEILRSTSLECERAEVSLAGRSALFRETQTQLHAGLHEVRAAIPDSAALIAYVRYFHGRPGDPVATSESRYLAFVLVKGMAHAHLVTLGDAVEIDSLVSDWRFQASKPPVDGSAAMSETRYRSVAQALKRRIWDPLVPLIANVRLALVVPDAALNLVSFGALPTSDSRYLIELGPTIHYLSAERDLVRGSGASSRGSILLLGNPDYDAGEDDTLLAAVETGSTGSYRGQRSDCRALTKSKWTRLPGTAQEVREVAALWKKVGGACKEFTAATATEAAFKRESRGRQALHLATHGFFLGGECSSALNRDARGIGGFASAKGTPQVEPPMRRTENPLLLSGLVLAGGNRSGQSDVSREDGILTAEEIAALDLSGTEWAVLSACETGVGVVQAGEGVFGLRRAFQVAGAGAVIMSLWSVEDEMTRAWMTALYEARLQERVGTAVAVQKADRTILEERRRRGLGTHPFYWAAFVGTGNWR